MKKIYPEGENDLFFSFMKIIFFVEILTPADKV